LQRARLKGGKLRRREFISLIGFLASLPGPSRAQQVVMPVIGLLGSSSPDPSAHGPFVASLRQGLVEAGFVEGRNLAIESRWAHGDFDKLPMLAGELVSRRVTVIATIGGDVTALAAKNATATIPIVFTAGGDPVRSGLVASMNRPGGNVTGITVLTSGLFAKRLELLREMVPGAEIIGLLRNRNNPNSVAETEEIVAAAAARSQRIVTANAGVDTEFDAALASLAQQGARAILVYPDAYYTGHRQQLVSAVARVGLPAVYHFREFAEAGGLISYGANFRSAFRLAGGYAARILKGEKAGDLPVQQPTTFELIINAKSAKAIGLTVPASLLSRADEVIE
jgi:putative tryptophan/tyrosine transport system substrate-binding protein